MELEAGFKEGDLNNIPFISNKMICDFIRKTTSSECNFSDLFKDESQTKIQFVQVRAIGEKCDVKALVLKGEAEGACVSIKVNTKSKTLLETACEKCVEKDYCQDVKDLLFWLYRKANDFDSPAIQDFYGMEIPKENIDFTSPVRIRDNFPYSELRLESDIAEMDMQDSDGQHFADAVLNELRNTGMQDSLLYKHIRAETEEFEPTFIHHMLLSASKNNVCNANYFLELMQEQAKQGLFARLFEETKTKYKSPLWMEVQYMRIRCSLIHSILARKDSSDDEKILESLFCGKRELNIEERKHVKQRKRHFLEQAEKIENQSYQECGLMVNEVYPFICASPDGFANDHIVEFKIPKTKNEFRKFLGEGDTVPPKYMAQIQIQMFTANVIKALYCVLSPQFENDGELHYVWVQIDLELVNTLLTAAEEFWRHVVFPRLARIYFNSLQ